MKVGIYVPEFFPVQWLNAGAFKTSYDVCRSKSLRKSFSYQNGNVMYCHNFSSMEGFLIHLSAAALKMSLKAHTQSYLVVAVMTSVWWEREENNIIFFAVIDHC